MIRSAIGRGVRPTVLALLCAVTLAALSTIAQQPRPALACSVGEDFDQIDDAEIIVAGRFTGWDYAPGVTFPATFGEGVESNSPLRDVPFNAHLLVEAVYKGDAPARLDVYDTSLDVYDHEPRYVWTGAHGACGAFYFDPTGVYAIVTLSEDADGRYRSFIFGWIYAGLDTSEPDFEEALKRLNDRGLEARAPGESESEGLSAIQIGGLFAAIALAAATIVTLRRAGRSASPTR